MWLTLAAAETAASGEVVVRVVDEEAMRALNRDYRQKDYPTNVLAFPAALAEMPGLPADDAALLGDVIICAPVVQREALEQSKTPADHWAHLLIHGVLHLLGFDHETPADAERMEALEAKILQCRGLQNPYEERSSN